MIEELINKAQLYILGLPIQDPMKNYYYSFLEGQRMSEAPEYEKLKRIRMLLEAIKARYYELWVNSPLAILLGTVINTLEDIGKGVIAGAKVGLDLAKPGNLIILLSIIAVITFIIFLIISKVKA